MNEGKVCRRCKLWKPLSEFHNMTASKDGKQSRCKPCQSGSLRKEYNREHYRNNRDHYSEVRRRWYEEHRDEHRERVLSKRDPKIHAERNRRWGQSPEGRLKKRENQALRRTEKGSQRDARGLGRFYKDVLARDGMVCHICGEEIPDLRGLHFDHVIPLSKGGLHTLENVRPSHAYCNRRKAARLAS